VLAKAALPEGISPVTAQELNACRRRLRLTQRALAERLNVTKARVRHWEQGNAAVPPQLWAPIRSLH
jgi:DNA-binding transcriptional regulator YiaG